MINIQTDSRKIKPGDIFVAVKCEVNDGHYYIKNAIKNGASKIVVEQITDETIETIVVNNTREYLNKYLKEKYDQYIKKMRMIGITGTNGKTTTSLLLHDALNLLGEKTCYIGTNGFYIKEKITNLSNTTVDICDMYDLLMEAYKQGCKNVVLEVSSHALANDRVENLKFDYAIFTNLTQDHLDEHGTMENYALAKQKLFKQIKTTGIAIINIDDKYKNMFLLEQNKNITYGFSKSDYQVIDYKLTNKGSKITYKNTSEYTIVTKLLGKYNIYNVLAVITVLSLIGYDDKIISKLVAPVGRLDTIIYNKNSIIIDYAHTPDALMNVFNTVNEFKKGKIYTVFGCTGDRDRIKRPIMTDIVSNNSDYFIITNDDPHFEDPNRIVSDMTTSIIKNNYEVCLNRKLAIEKGINLLKENDILLILGKGHEEYIIIGKEKIEFNDKKEVLKYIKNQVKQLCKGHLFLLFIYK